MFVSRFDLPAYALALALGLVLGSFLNVVIYRGPSIWGLIEGEPRGDLLSPRSYCPACKTPVPRVRLVPLLSFFMQRGRCAACGAPIPFRYPLVEATGAAVAAASVAIFGLTFAAPAAAAFGLALLALAFIDLETGYLPDAITLPLIGGGLVANAFGLFVPLADAALGAAAGYAIFRVIGFLFETFRNKEGLGQGDAKLVAAIGAWCGWPMLPFVVFVGAAGTLAAVLLLRAVVLPRAAGKISPPAAEGAEAPLLVPLRGEPSCKQESSYGRRLAAPIPFGPGLCAAGFIALLAGAKLFTAP